MGGERGEEALILSFYFPKNRNIIIKRGEMLQ